MSSILTSIFPYDVFGAEYLEDIMKYNLVICYAMINYERSVNSMWWYELYLHAIIPVNSMFAVCSTEILEYSTPTWIQYIKFEIFKYGSPSIFMAKKWTPQKCNTHNFGVFTDLNQASNICQKRSEKIDHFLDWSQIADRYVAYHLSVFKEFICG